MPTHDISSILELQKIFFRKGETRSFSFRIAQLKKLKLVLSQYETQIIDALKKDLNKPKTEALLSEILFVMKEIDFSVKHLKKWMKHKKIPTPLPFWPGRSSIHFEPYGSVFIIAAWNYPFLLLFSPLIGAISAGNCIIVKPSEIAKETKNIILEIINSNFSPNYLFALDAAPSKMPSVLKEKFDYIFFTGSQRTGKIVMEAASKHLTPCTLELGGKSPCIVDQSANLAYAARRIIWAKTLNAGQTCIAPDYLYLHISCKEIFIEQLKKVLLQFYGQSLEKSSDYGKIINQIHFERLIQLMRKGNIIYGGETKKDELFISPTLMDEISWEDPIMQEEIFGPILPILTYNDFDEVIYNIQKYPKPLALYCFTKNKMHEEKIMNQLSFGGGCMNDCLLQIANLQLPFGGVNQSGIGIYHGQYSFETFSHRKSIYKKILPLDTKLEYPPYNEKKLKWVRWLLKSL